MKYFSDFESNKEFALFMKKIKEKISNQNKIAMTRSIRLTNSKKTNE